MDLDPELITKLLAIKMPAASAREVLRVLADHQPAPKPISASTLRSQRFRARQRNPETVACNVAEALHATPKQRDGNVAETLQPPSPPLPPQTPPSPPLPPPPSLARSRTMHDWAHDIVKAYPHLDNQTENISFMTNWLNRHPEHPPHTVLVLVNQCVAIIKAKAPNGMASQFVPTGKAFFIEEKFLAPQAFENRWTPPKSPLAPVNGAYTADKATAGLSVEQITGRRPTS